MMTLADLARRSGSSAAIRSVSDDELRSLQAQLDVNKPSSGLGKKTVRELRRTITGELWRRRLP